MCSKVSFEEEPINKANMKEVEVKEEENVERSNAPACGLNPRPLMLKSTVQTTKLRCIKQRECRRSPLDSFDDKSYISLIPFELRIRCPLTKLTRRNGWPTNQSTQPNNQEQMYRAHTSATALLRF